MSDDINQQQAASSGVKTSIGIVSRKRSTSRIWTFLFPPIFFQQVSVQGRKVVFGILSTDGVEVKKRN